MTKYHAQKVEVDGYKFDSRREAERYWTLKRLQELGTISGLQVHSRWRIEVNGQHVCTYEDDFTYFDNEAQQTITEDVKGVRTPVYTLKKKLMRAVHGVEIKEVR